MACSPTPRRRRTMSSTMIILSSLYSSSSPSFRCDAFTGMITTSSNRQGIAAAARRRRSSKPIFVDSTTDINGGIVTNGSEEGVVAAVDAALFGLVVDDATKVTSTLNTVVEEARELWALENEILGPDGAPLAPMMTYQKYVTMQEKRVKVTVRYTAEAGLRPFYLTVANRIKLAHPDVLLEKRILPRAGDGPSGETVFEVIIDGKTIIGKKKTKLLKVSSRMSSRSSSVGDDDEGGSSSIMESGDKKKKDGGKRREYGDGRAIPDVAAGGRTIFVSMEKLDQELVKARKKRRPNTAYKTKEDVVRGTTGSSTIGGGLPLAMLGGTAEDVDVALRMAAEDEMKEAVVRLERLKAMSTRSKI